jgi:transcriptional regulator with XRE-family HTH domain
MQLPPDWPRTPSQLRVALAGRNISQQRLARLAGVNPRTVRRWCDDRQGDDRQLALATVALVGLVLTQHDAQDPAASSPPAVAPDTSGEK